LGCGYAPKSNGFFTLEGMSEKRVYPLRMESMRRMMHKSEEIDQFQMLEDKVDSLIKMATAMKRERESLLEKIHIQEEKIANLASEAEALKATRDKAKQRILSLLEKIEQIEIEA
jgi:septal ring factor EnvC (AmiA/AmiB activator)